MDCPYCNIIDYKHTPTCDRQDNLQICPHVRRCLEHHIWKPLMYMANCPIRFAPTGNVQFERHGYLYVQFGEQIIKVKNPYDYIPMDVKIEEIEGKYKVIKEIK